jgi:hypothetical protein
LPQRGFTAIYAVVCPLGETHHYLVREGGRVEVVEFEQQPGGQRGVMK